MMLKCRLTIAVDQKDNLTAMQKGGGIGPMSLDEIDSSMEMAVNSARTILAQIEEAKKNR